MPTPIIPEPSYSDVILPFAAIQALVRKAVLYHRHSNYSQAGTGKVKLMENTEAIRQELCRVAPTWEVVSVVQGVEGGKLSEKRRFFRSAVEEAIKHNSIIVGSDASRIFRPEDYCRCTNRDARPTKADVDQFREITRGIPIATLLAPDMSESERHSHATKRTGKAGRPSKLTREQELRILEWLGPNTVRSNGKRRFRRSYREVEEVLKEEGVDKSLIQRLLDSLIPDGSGRLWKDILCPYLVYRRIWEMLGRPSQFPRVRC